MADNQTIKGRLLLYLETQNIKKSHFEKKCGLCNGYINSIVNSISPNKLEAITLNYPDLNTGWLMTGEGTMLKVDATASSFQEAEEKAMIEEIRKVTADLEEEIERLKRQIANRDETITVLTKALNKAQNDGTIEK